MGQTEWLTVKQAAARAQVSEATVRREVKARRMTAARVGGRRSWRLRADWVDEWLQAAAQPAIQVRLS
jgi:excisionase family DNA binding protein